MELPNTPSEPKRGDPSPRTPRDIGAKVLDKVVEGGHCAVDGVVHAEEKMLSSVAHVARSVSVHELALLDKIEKPDRSKLTKIEMKRKELLARGMRGHLVVLFSWRGTVLSWALLSPILWVTVATYAACRALVRADVWENDQLPQVSMGQISLLSGFLYFFLVFYVSHGYSRFVSQYGSSMSMEGRIFDSCSMAVAAMPRASAHRLMRHLNGAHVLAYVGLNDTYNVANFLRHFQRANQVFTVAEWKRIHEIGADAGGAACREVIAWAIQDIHAEARVGNIGSSLELALMEQVCRLRGSIGTLYDYAYQPIPFFYVHFVTIVSTIYLPLSAYAIALVAANSVQDMCRAATEFEAEQQSGPAPSAPLSRDIDFCEGSAWVEVVGGLVILLQSVFVLGLQAIGKQLADPYGSDVIDMSVEHFLSFTLKSARKIVEAERVAGEQNTGPTPDGTLGLHWRRPVTEDGTWMAADGPIKTPSGWESVEIGLASRQHENDELDGCKFARVDETVHKKNGVATGELKKKWVMIEPEPGPLYGIAPNAAALEEEMRENARLSMIADAEEVEHVPVMRMGGGGLGVAFEKWKTR